MPQHEIYISVGSNIDKEHYTRAARSELEQVFGDVICSSVYESEPVGFEGESFYNLVVYAKTSMPLNEVCAALKEIEARNGRVHTDKKFCSRTLDLDLLTYDEHITSEPVVLPRDEILYNAFVLLPLAEIAPARKHPVTQQTYHHLWQQYDKTNQKLWPIDFTWSVHA